MTYRVFASLISCYFLWGGKLYEQVNGVAMGSPVSPVIAIFYMKSFEEHALTCHSSLKPEVWLYRYVNDIFVVQNRGEEELHKFLAHRIRENMVQFTIDIEQGPWVYWSFKKDRDLDTRLQKTYSDGQVF